MKKLTVLCLAMLMLLGAVAIGEGADVTSFDGGWVPVPGTEMEVFLPLDWAVLETTQEGLLSAQGDGQDVRLDVQTADPMDEMPAEMPVTEESFNGRAFSLMDITPNTRMGYTMVGDQYYVFAFVGMGAPEARTMANEIMGSLRVMEETNG